MDELTTYQVAPLHYGRLLVAVDVDDFISSRRAFDRACTIAKRNKVPLVVATVLETEDLNVFETMTKDTMATKRQQAQQVLDQYVAKAEAFGVEEVTSTLGEGRPGHVMVEQILPHIKPDLLLLGSEPKPGHKKTIGPHAMHMAKYANCSVTIVRADAKDAQA